MIGFQQLRPAREAGAAPGRVRRRLRGVRGRRLPGDQHGEGQRSGLPADRPGQGRHRRRPAAAGIHHRVVPARARRWSDETDPTTIGAADRARRARCVANTTTRHEFWVRRPRPEPLKDLHGRSARTGPRSSSSSCATASSCRRCSPGDRERRRELARRVRSRALRGAPRGRRRGRAHGDRRRTRLRTEARRDHRAPAARALARPGRRIVVAIVLLIAWVTPPAHSSLTRRIQLATDAAASRSRTAI